MCDGGRILKPAILCGGCQRCNIAREMHQAVRLERLSRSSDEGIADDKAGRGSMSH